MSKINVFSYNLRMDNPGDGINAFSKERNMFCALSRSMTLT